MRSLGISVLSLTLTTIVVVNAYYQKKQFYPSVVYITKSNPSMAVIYIQAFICVLIMGKLMRKIFFGQLRSAEFEHLLERSWYAITETCLAFTVFRDDFNPKFVALFTLLLFLKSFHWLAEDRIDYMERSPIIGIIFHIRVLSLLLLLGIMDVLFIDHAYESTISKGASVQLVFGFEYAILITVVVNILLKYIFHSVDLNSETPWDNKAVFLLYTELIMGLIKVILYVAFVAIMIRIYTLPLFAFRPMYYTIRNFKKAFTDVILSRRAIHNMNTLYPNATAEELQAADNVCIICREEMTTASKKLPCNHIFHTSCLRSWFQRQQTCPTCRLNILRTTTPILNGGGVAAAAAQAPPAEQQQRVIPPGAAAVGGNNNQQQQANIIFDPFGAGGGVVGGPNPFNLLNQQQQQHLGAIPTFHHHHQQQHYPHPNNNNNIGAPPPPPFVFPPFPFMPFMTAPPPPPLPPPHLRGLSADELQRMEGTARDNIEARIQCLRNIQIMLDSAVVMMQQYTIAANNSPIIPQSSPPPQPPPVPTANGLQQSDRSPPLNNTNTTTSTTLKNDSGGGGSSTTSTNNDNDLMVDDDNNRILLKGEEVIPEQLVSVGITNSTTTTTTTTIISPSSSSSDEELLRRRRLQRFHAEAVAAATGSTTTTTTTTDQQH